MSVTVNHKAFAARVAALKAEEPINSNHNSGKCEVLRRHGGGGCWEGKRLQRGNWEQRVGLHKKSLGVQTSTPPAKVWWLCIFTPRRAIALESPINLMCRFLGCGRKPTEARGQHANSTHSSLVHWKHSSYNFESLLHFWCRSSWRMAARRDTV